MFVLARLKAERKVLERESEEQNPKLYKLISVSEDMLTWQLEIYPQSTSVYASAKFGLQLTFTHEYPVIPPNVIFTTKIFHPNIDEDEGDVHNSMKSQWSPIITANTLVLSLIAYLDNPDVEAYVANVKAAELYQNNRMKFEEVVAEWVYKYADGFQS